MGKKFKVFFRVIYLKRDEGGSIMEMSPYVLSQMEMYITKPKIIILFS